MFPISVRYLRGASIASGVGGLCLFGFVGFIYDIALGVCLLVEFVSLLVLMCGDFGCLLILLVVLQLLSYRRCILCGYYFGYCRFSGFGWLMGLLMITYVVWRDACGAYDLGF